MTLIFNTSSYPFPIEIDLLNGIEAQNQDYESSFLELNAPPFSLRLPSAARWRLGVFVVYPLYRERGFAFRG